MRKLFTGDAPSIRWQFSKADLISIGKVALYSAVSALVGTLIIIIPQVNVPAGWLWMVPVINIVLVAAKQFFDGGKVAK